MSGGIVLVFSLLFAVFVFVGLPLITLIIKIFAWATGSREMRNEDYVKRCARALEETLKRVNEKKSIKRASSYTPTYRRDYRAHSEWMYKEDPSVVHCGKINNLVEEYKINELMEYISKIYNSGDPQSNAEEIYGFVEHAVYMMYPIRDYNGGYRREIMELCELGLSVIDKYIEKRRGTAVIVAPTKYAILLEQARRFDEAIDLCLFCESRPEIRDYGYDSFAKRREHLVRKKSKVHRVNTASEGA